MKYNQNKKERKEQGFDILPTKIWEDKQLKPSTILVYNKIVALSRNSGYSYASHGTLAKMLNTSKSTIKRDIKKLLALKYIITIQSYKMKDGKLADDVLHIYPIKLLEVYFDIWGMTPKQRQSYVNISTSAIIADWKKEKEQITFEMNEKEKSINESIGMLRVLAMYDEGGII